MSTEGMSRELAGNVMLVALLAAAAFVGFFAWSAMRVDDRSLDRQLWSASFALREQITQLPVQQSSSTTWDEAVAKVKAGDAAWISDNLTAWMGTYFGHDKDFVLDANDQPVQLAADGRVVDKQLFGQEWPQIQGIVRALRDKMRKASAGLDDSTPALTDMSAGDVILLDGQPAIVSARPIIPDTDAMQQRPGTEAIHVAVQNIDQTMVDGIGREFSLAAPRVELSDQSGFWLASVPVSSNDGKVLAHVIWTRDRPGVALVEEAAPAFVVALLLGFGLLTFMLWRLRRSSIQLQASEAQTQFLAFHDTLTGLPNRALFEDRLERALGVARTDRNKVALFCIDLDRFKHINDTLGHPAGDELVRQVAQRLSSAVREVDTVARLGGDEFAIIQVGVTSELQAAELANRVLAGFDLPFDLFEDRTFITASIGVVLSQTELESRQDLLRKADIALYDAKNQGRAVYRFFDGEMDDVVRHRRSIEKDLRSALLHGNGLSLAYQPIFNAEQKIIGAEALARWDHPVHGSLSPQVFISIAEERGLISQLGDFVLREACKFATESHLPWVAVNVSPIQFRSERLVEKVTAILDETGLRPDRLQLEITEGVLLDNPNTASAIIGSLRAKGIRVALDDFGTGYSSMSYLRSYGVDKLKIDRSFIQELGVSPDATAIVKAMVSLAQAMNMRVTAEGVETVDQRDQLARIGCHELQGFLLSRPMSPHQLEAIMRDTWQVWERGHTIARS